MGLAVAAVNVETLAHNWGAVLLRGVMGVLFGLITFAQPGITLAVLVLLFGAYAFVDGMLAVVSALRRRGMSDRWGLLLVEGLAGIAAGVATLFWPGLTAIVLLYVIAAWAVVTGVFEIAAAIRLRKAITGEWLLVLSGIASIGFGVLLTLFPGAGALALVFWIGAYALVFGTLLIALAFRLRSWGRTHTSHGHRPAHVTA
jgi:uncharacterized membrane protein HdeD (DUF308 family)